MRTLATVPLLCLLLLPRIGHATGIPVFDAALNTLGIQEQWNQLKALYESVQQTANQIKQIENQARQIEGMYTQIEQGAKNLVRLDVSNATDLFNLLQQLENKLHQAEYIGYQAQSAVTQARTLYPRIQGVLTAEQQRLLNLHWATMRRNSAEVSVSVQAVREAQGRTQAQWTTILRQAQQAQGNLQIQQAQMQAQGVIGHQLLAIEQQLATQARERSEQALESASRVELEQHLVDKALQPLEGRYEPAGRLLPMPRTGRE
jgi:conjugal transfer/entry exclusion protein